MAIVHCPSCNQRISSQHRVCPHCDAALADLSPEERARLKRRRWQGLLYRARNLHYLGLIGLVFGSIWWWFYGPTGFSPPPPAGGLLLVVIGAVLYVTGRGWAFWLRLPRNRP